MFQQIILPKYNNKLEEELIKLFHSSDLPLHFNKTGNKTNEKLYLLILTAIEFLKSRRNGIPISKSLPIYKYYEKQYGITNLFMIKLSKGSRGFYTNVSGGQFKVLQIILEVEETHKSYEKKGNY